MLESLACAHRIGQAMAPRARLVLAAAAGLENKALCAEVEVDANTVSKSRRPSPRTVWIACSTSHAPA